VAVAVLLVVVGRSGWRERLLNMGGRPLRDVYNPIRRVAPGYLGSTLLDERRELAHHQVHALEAGLFQFDDLLFDHRLEGQVGGEQARSESPRWGAC